MSLLSLISLMSKGSGETSPPIGPSIVPIETGLGIALSGYPIYVRNTTNSAEIGQAADLNAVVTLLNADGGWNAFGTWSNGSGNLVCSGSAPARVIAYNKVGQLFSSNVASDWGNLTAGLSVSDVSGGVRVLATTPGTYNMYNNAYGVTFLSDIEIRMTFELTSGLLYQGGIKFEGWGVYYSDMQGNITSDGGAPSYSKTGTVDFLAGTYTLSLILKRNTTKFTLTKGANSIVSTSTRDAFSEGATNGKIQFVWPEIDLKITDFKVLCDAYKNTDHVVVGDSVTWGQGATTVSSTWWNQIMANNAHSVYAHSNQGFDIWQGSVAELVAIDAVNIWVMGSYVNTPEGQSTFESKYNAFINAIDGGANLQRIVHLASFPNNFSENILPFNAFKATLNTGIHQYIDDYYAELEESGGTGSNLKDVYDFLGSHLTQAAQDYVASTLLPSV